MLDYTGTLHSATGEPPRVGDAVVGTAVLTTGAAVTGSMTVTSAVSGTITAQQSITGSID